jgi:hypothetical protein
MFDIMKNRRLALVVAIALVASGVHAVEIGDRREAVVAELGTPTGTVSVGQNTILTFERGNVKLRSDRVVAVNLITAAELTARKAAAAEALQRLEADGLAAYKAKKADAAFAALPAGDQLRYWQSFAGRYPMISVEAEIAPLVAIVDEESDARALEAAHDERLAALEERVDDAEARAARAEREARRARYNSYDGYGNPAVFPVGSGRPHHRPPEENRPPAKQPATVITDTTEASRDGAMSDIEDARARAYSDVGRR